MARRPMPFQFDRPVFVRIPFDGHKRTFKVGDEFKWKELGVNELRVEILYNKGWLHHNSDMEVKTKVGDGLEELTVEGLHDIVNSINDKVKAKTNSKLEFDNKKCKKSKIADKQRGLIRSWRRKYGHLETE